MTEKANEVSEDEIQRIARRPYHRLIHGEPTEGYLGEVLELSGCITAGATPEETLANLTEAMEVWIESALAHGDAIPEPLLGSVRIGV